MRMPNMHSALQVRRMSAQSRPQEHQRLQYIIIATMHHVATVPQNGVVNMYPPLHPYCLHQDQICDDVKQQWVLRTPIKIQKDSGTSP